MYRKGVVVINKRNGQMELDISARRWSGDIYKRVVQNTGGKGGQKADLD
jgi:hypothetical protein